MNKDDIKKALDCCLNPSINPCKDCPYNKNGDFSYCNDKILKDTLNLITEQEKKIEKLKAENKQLKTECALLDDELRIARQGTIDVLNKLKEKFKGYEAWYYDGIEESYHDLEEEINEFIKELISNAKDKS